MSLHLRKVCQEILDGVGLSSYHVQIDERTKILQIVGECGQSFVSISGIRLSRMAPSKEEIFLALELFEAFIVKHKPIFDSYIKAKVAASKIKIPVNVKNLPNAIVEKTRYGSSWEMRFVLKNNKDCRVVVESTGGVNISSTTFDGKTINAEKIQYGLSSKEATAIIQWINSCKEYNKAAYLANKLKEKLSSCEI